MRNESVKLQLGDFLFTWDDEKALVNVKKHHISFPVAASVFLDGGAIIGFNSIDDDSGEERFDITGMALPGVLFVVFVERLSAEDENVIRIISARRANRKERQRYVDGLE